MKAQTIKIKEGLYLNSVLAEIPTNTILFKTAPGIGATHMEILADRHSIIIEPNVPVIKGKKKQFPDVFGVHENIDVYQISQYLKKDNIRYKKIITTPESFYKVKEAMEDLKINPYDNFFMMYDECERTMKDVKFREKIVAPMKDFFQFANKAFVSATAVVPSDPKFIKQGFGKLIIEPDYDFAKDMDLIITNHVFLAIKEKIETIQSSNLFIFFNSTKGISNLIEKLGIREETNVYCSKSSKEKVKNIDPKRIHDDLTDEFAKYNFFTSRFYSAVDIFLDDLPDVILVTDLWTAPHTMIDPESDAIQIAGRFRNGVKSITAVTNIDWNLNAKAENEAIGYLEGCKEGYKALRGLRDGTQHDGAIDVLNEALNLVSFSSFVNDDGTTNHFMIDNYLNDEKVKCLYKNKKYLLKAYSESKHFNVKPMCVKYKVSDIEKPDSDKKEKDYYKKLIDSTISQLREIDAPTEMMYVVDNSATVLEELNSTVPEIVLAYRILTPEQIAKCSSKRSLIYATKEQQIADDKSNFQFIETLKIEFEIGRPYAPEMIISKLKKAIEKYAPNLKPEIKLLDTYFQLQRTSLNKGKGYKILSSRFNNEKS